MRKTGKHDEKRSLKILDYSSSDPLDVLVDIRKKRFSTLAHVFLVWSFTRCVFGELCMPHAVTHTVYFRGREVDAIAI